MAGGPPVGEGLNPTRRYKWFRPRQAAFASVDAINNTNWATCWLYNNSSGDKYLVLRSWQTANLGDNRVFMFTQQGLQGSSPAAGFPMVPGEATIPGQVTGTDEATQTTAGYRFDNNVHAAYWFHDFPLIVLPPGYSVGFQCATQGTGMRSSFMWEAIFADELDWFW